MARIGSYTCQECIWGPTGRTASHVTVVVAPINFPPIWDQGSVEVDQHPILAPHFCILFSLQGSVRPVITTGDGILPDLLQLRIISQITCLIAYVRALKVIFLVI